MGTYSYKNPTTFFIIFSIIFFEILVGALSFFVPVFGPIIFIVFSVIAITLGFFLPVYFKKKYFIDQRAKKRKRALIKVGGHIKRSASVLGNYTIFNNQVMVKFFVETKDIKIYGRQRGIRDEITISAKSDIINLVDDVWDYICISFDRTISLAYLYNIFRLNCLEISVENVERKEDIDAIIKAIEDECDRESVIDFSYSKKDFNSLSKEELLNINGMSEELVNSIIEFKTTYGPICSQALLINKIKVPQEVIKANSEIFKLPNILIERYKFEQAFNLVDV